MNITKSALSVLTTLVMAVSFSAQNRTQDKKPIPPGEMSNYVVSAKAGVVNIVEGEASVIRAHLFAMPEMLISGDELQPGDTVKTGANGRVEILLDPGCYLRLGDASHFVFLFDDFTSNKVKLLSGSAIIEASAIDGPIFVETPKAKFEIARTGLYRFNAVADGKSEIIVRKGQAIAGDATINGGKQAIVDGGTAAIAKLSKQDVDALDDWSKTRARALILANNSLSSRGMRSTTGMAFMNYNAWIYDPFRRCYTFLPLTGGFSSPYGWDYSVYNPYWYQFAWPGYYSGGSYGNGGSGNRGGSSGSSGSGGRGSGSSGGNSGGGHHHDPSPPHRELPQLPTRPSIQSDPGRGSGSGASSAPVHRHP